MRLMCPNCDAEYEVDASAIPESGRDVQCSNCGHAWFQQHPDHEADNEAEAALYDPPPPLSKAGMTPSILPSDLDWQVDSDDPEAILDAMGREVGADAPDRWSNESAAPQQAGSDRAEPAPKHELDPEALQILRQEAEFETAQRALEQGDNAAEPAAESAAAPVVARRVARLKGIQPPALNAPPTPAARTPGERLPKIETVSAALRNDDLLPLDANPKPKTGRGGLFAMLLIALTATAAYVLSPDLSVLVPSLAKPLAQFVDFIDGLRDQLDILLPKGIALVQGMVSQAISLGAGAIALVKGWF